MSATVTITTGYVGTDYTRNYKFADVSDAVLSGMTAKVKSINASLEAGTAGGLSSFFLGDQGEALASIVGLKSQVDSVEVIQLEGGA